MYPFKRSQAHIGDRRCATDCRHIAKILVDERPVGLSLHAAHDVARRVLPHLNRDLRHTRQRFAIGACERSRSPITKTLREPGTVRSGSTRTRPARSIGAPSVAPSGDAATPAAQMMVAAGMTSAPTSPVPRRRESRPPGTHVDSEANRIRPRRSAQRLGERAQHERSGLDQDDVRRACDRNAGSPAPASGARSRRARRPSRRRSARRRPRRR